MRKVNSTHFTPLMRISIILTLSIIASKSCYKYIDALYWLVASLLSWGTASALHLMKKSPRDSVRLVATQCVFLYLCIFCIGGLVTSYNIGQKYVPLQTFSEENLSSFDRTIIASRKFQQKISKDMQSHHITGQDYAVIAAMTLGDKTSINKETKDIYSLSGASHILAVSGLHIGIIFQIFILLTGGRRRSATTIFLSLISIWTYVIFIGRPASAVRSATMISICCFSLLSHKETLSTNNLCFAYVIMLVINPLYLFDISFQMSFLAVTFIITFTPIAITGQRFSKWLKGMFYISLSAQIGTTPLIAYYFGRVSCYSILTSFIAIPTATAIIYLSAIALFLEYLNTLFPLLSSFIDPLLDLTTSSLISITQVCNTVFKFITTLPGESIEGIKINLVQLFLIYFSLTTGYIYIKKATTYLHVSKKNSTFAASL